ncbi:MAG: zinc ribbon domain-containing protein [Thermoleophilaceae bacterium]|nr:zinc ribbon domain-containing protein [Thermoleophilaceae bacterium]
MPLYEYKCEKGHLMEVLQSMSDDPVTECEKCGAATKRVFHAPAVHFKGSGFYNTDYGKQKQDRGAADNGGSSSDSSSEKSSEKKSETKKESKSESKSSDD